MTQESMMKLGLLASTIALALVAACSPADGIPVVHAQSHSASLALWPAPAPGSVDGHVHEYH